MEVLPDALNLVVVRTIGGQEVQLDWRRPTWTRELLIATMVRLTGVRIHVTTMSRALALIQARRGRPKKRYLAGALDVRTGVVIWVQGERKTSYLFRVGRNPRDPVTLATGLGITTRNP
jgi:hypothetical protein